ncbi:hypothetical protein FACS18948_6470 [Clostridia bacterium]|nr:hypothetical protein FACS18948_6470 [Clostridia bacterium]
MKFKNIAALCKKTKYAMLHNYFVDQGGGQWIEDGTAWMRISGLPRLDQNSVLNLLDVQGKQLDAWFISECSVKPDVFDVSSNADSEQSVEAFNLSVVFNGESWKPLHTSAGVQFIRNRYIAALLSEYESLDLYERTTQDGALYIVAKSGFFVELVITPRATFDEEQLEELCAAAYGASEANSARMLREQSGTGFREQIQDVLRPYGAVEFKEGDSGSEYELRA